MSEESKPRKMTKGRRRSHTLITINLNFSLGEGFAFLLPFTIFFFGWLNSKLWKPTIAPDSFHRTPRISRVPTVLGVTDSWTWQSSSWKYQFRKVGNLKIGKTELMCNVVVVLVGLFLRASFLCARVMTLHRFANPVVLLWFLVNWAKFLL